MNQYVIKANEQEEDFNKNKINTSLLKASANNQLSESAVEVIDRQFKNYMNTRVMSGYGVCL